MPYLPYSGEIPPSDDVKIWRFMDFTKFMSMLSTNTLRFTSAGKMEDPYECAFTKSDIDLLEHSDRPDIAEALRRIYKIKRYAIFLNCWHMNEFESAAMWKLYLNNHHEGIAIQSTIKRLKDCFSKSPELVTLCTVKYIDYGKGTIFDEEGRAGGIHKYKRKSFEHEKELRVFYNDSSQEGLERLQKEIYIDGANIGVDLNILIEKVYAAPTSPSWFVELVKRMLTTFSLDREAIKSDLYSEPIR